MSALAAAAKEAHDFFLELGVPYAIIGGLAVQYWGEPRFTQDIDLTVSAPLDNLEDFIKQILDRFVPRFPNALEFALQNRVVLVETASGYPLDIALGLPGYEDEVMRRTIDYELSPGTSVRLCSAEDLIIHKLVAGRAQDVRDVEGIVFRQGNSLDVAYIRLWVTEFADVIGTPELGEPFENALRRRGD